MFDDTSDPGLRLEADAWRTIVRQPRCRGGRRWRAVGDDHAATTASWRWPPPEPSLVDDDWACQRPKR
jgi:hypothetical protein